MDPKKVENRNRRLFIWGSVLGGVLLAAAIGLLLVAAFGGENGLISEGLVIALVCIAVPIMAVAIITLTYADWGTGSFFCKHCGSHFSPTLTAYICGPHINTTRKLRCPKCGEKSWCKRTNRFEDL